jgi:hypothetical protein
MSQIRITKQRRTAGARRHRRVRPPLPLDPRVPDVTRAKQLQRRPGRPSGTRLSGDDLHAGPGAGMSP